ncbi:MAG: thioredoxin [Caldiserica bacterium]|nr:MAG: thioredoxin [Caldisericota bacterium]
MKEVTEKEFKKDVIEKSKEKPVLVDFWADWCQPCLIFSPILEELEKEYHQEFIFYKVNIKENESLALQLGIQAIPTIKIFKDGKVVASFTGVLSKQKLKSILDKFIPQQAEKLIKEAETLLKEGRFEEVEKKLKEAESLKPDNPQVKLKLGLIYFKKNEIEKAKSYLKEVTQFEDANRILSYIYFLETPEEDIDKLKKILEKNPDDLEVRLRIATQYVKKGKYREALDEYLEVIKRNKKYKDEIARKLMLKVFLILGNDASLTHEYQRKLVQVLF